MVFHWSLSDNKSPQFSRTVHKILTDLNNAVVWMVSTRLFIFKLSNPFVYPSVTVPRVPLTIDITVNFTFHTFFQFPWKIEVLIYFFTFFQFYFVVSQGNKVHNSATSFVIIIIIIIILINPLSVFHVSVSWWSFTGVWVKASLHKSSGLFSVFWPFSIIL